MSASNYNIIPLGFGMIGALTAIALVYFGNTSDLQHVWVNEIGLVFVAALSAWCAGIACAWLFGKPGHMGWFLAGIGAVVATLLGAAIAGTLIVPIIGTLIAPGMLVGEAVINPPILIIWLALMAGLHLIATKSKS
jgi:hypothetical protein